MPATAARPRRVSPSTWELRAHRAAVAVARAALRLPRRRRTPARAVPKVTILLVHAWGMGGTIRTMLTVAGWLARRHEVEVLSVWRTRERPFFAFPPGVTVTAADDRRPGAGGRTARLLRRLPGPLLFPGDCTHSRMTLWSDVQLVRHLRASRPDVVIGTRPGAQPAGRERRRGAGAGGERAHRVLGLPRAAAARDLAPLPRARRRRGARRAGARAARGRRAGVGDPERGAAVRRSRRRGWRRRWWWRRGGSCGAKGYDRLIRAFTWVAEAHPGGGCGSAAAGRARATLAALIDELRLGERVELAGKVQRHRGRARGGLGVRAQLARRGAAARAARGDGEGARGRELRQLRRPVRGDRARRRRPARAGRRRARARAGDLRADRVAGPAAAARRRGADQGRGLRDRDASGRAGTR